MIELSLNTKIPKHITHPQHKIRSTHGSQTNSHVSLSMCHFSLDSKNENVLVQFVFRLKHSINLFCL